MPCSGSHSTSSCEGSAELAMDRKRVDNSLNIFLFNFRHRNRVALPRNLSEGPQSHWRRHWRCVGLLNSNQFWRYSFGQIADVSWVGSGYTVVIFRVWYSCVVKLTHVQLGLDFKNIAARIKKRTYGRRRIAYTGEIVMRSGVRIERP